MQCWENVSAVWRNGLIFVTKTVLICDPMYVQWILKVLYKEGGYFFGIGHVDYLVERYRMQQSSVIYDKS